jgi:hypothetical protein
LRGFSRTANHLLTRRRRATAVLLIPLAQSNTIPARQARAWAELRRRTHRSSVDRIIYSIFQRFTLEWKTRTLRIFTQAA